MEKLDLHSISHMDARNETIRFIEANWKSGGSELEIITGYSLPMQKIVIKVLDEYELEWQIGDYLAVNKGFIRVTLP
ncbi:hypothetical protein LCGC14_1078580 [marine sediment metagenome]|uniref:Smr domain-containing protein n=1 Tax=marine sediment metagenome TaxID=412755 RepID=A0A0F9QLT3_9ZZZZ